MLTFRQFIREARKPKEDEYYYHLTKGSSMNNIAKKGLLRKSGHRNYDFSKRSVVYLATSPKTAKSYAGDFSSTEKHTKTGWKDIPHSLRVIRIPRANLDPKKIHRDKNMEGNWNDEKPRTWEYHGDIPAKKIEFSGGETIRKNSKAWKKVDIGGYDSKW